jgi:hypothetical protein
MVKKDEVEKVDCQRSNPEVQIGLTVSLQSGITAHAKAGRTSTLKFLRCLLGSSCIFLTLQRKVLHLTFQNLRLLLALLNIFNPRASRYCVG